MIRVTVSYPPHPDCQFNHEYYQSTHAQLIRDKLDAHGLVKLEMDQALPDPGGKLPASVAAAHMFFNDLDSFKGAMKAEGKLLGDDRENYTDIIPVVVVSQVIF
ncbi:Ethyl tert-butyl ether degradation EthD [Pseudomonas cichorii]|uniref:Ethyl tert-butyl ether degradation EthD n=1 Tax=Pseudomonas cichorii TaxID=36746 RepID=A0A3M4LWG6_PSECI|nr:EthD family reductase [Pseudomonas cichorii]RMQ45852.1 Ethyl tert-butyl ether degradation EthD [Pseudomonas cichorii]